MKILLVHAWLTGNLGDIWHMTGLVERLRRLGPSRLTLSGFPAPAPACAPLLAAIDEVLHENPTIARRPPVRQWARWQHRRERRRLFERFDAVVSIPGPFLRSEDPRVEKALLDVEVAREVGVPFVFACHSIGPLRPPQLARLRQATLLVAREPATHRYLQQRGIEAVQGADFAFATAPGEVLSRPRPAGLSEAPYGLAFLRSNNLRLDRVRLEGSTVYHGNEILWTSTAPRIVLATSDIERDGSRLHRLSERLGVQALPCESLEAMWAAVSSATDVLSDRYHPAIAAVLAGKPVEILPIAARQKMAGLQELVRDWALEDIRACAKNALERIVACLVEQGSTRSSYRRAGT